MRSLKALKELIRNFQFNNAEQTREIQWQQLRVLKEMDLRVAELEEKMLKVGTIASRAVPIVENYLENHPDAK